MRPPIDIIAIDVQGHGVRISNNCSTKIALMMADVNMTDEVGSGRLPEGMGGLAKGLAIIEAFSPHRTRMTVSEAAQSSGTSRASARRCLLTLAGLGYATTDQELEIGLRSIAVPVMDSHGAVVAAMSASASSARVSLAQMVKGFLPVLKANAVGLGHLVTSAAG